MCATRSRARMCSAYGWHCAAPQRPGWRRSSARRATTSGEPVEAIGREELRQRLKRGDVVLVDVRPEEEFAAGHIDGARSVPLEELEQRIAELPADRDIVAYCRGPFCAYAHEAVRQLQEAGRSALRLEDGWPEWRLAETNTDKTKTRRRAA